MAKKEGGLPVVRIQTNRGNIDSTLSSLDNVVATLAVNRTNLERTLCSLPAGVAPYYQTSSWGQWFNVRVTEITFKDNSGKIIADQKEGPLARGPNQLRPVVTCGGAPLKKAHGSSGPVAPTGLAGFLDFVTQKAAR